MHKISVNIEENIYSMKCIFLICKLEYHYNEIDWSSLPGKWFYHITTEFIAANKIISELCESAVKDAAAYCDSEYEIPIQNVELTTCIALVHSRGSINILNALDLEPME